MLEACSELATAQQQVGPGPRLLCLGSPGLAQSIALCQWQASALSEVCLPTGRQWAIMGLTQMFVFLQMAALQEFKEHLQEKVASLQSNAEGLQWDVQESKKQAQQQVRQTIWHRHVLDRWQAALAWAAASTTGQTGAASLVKQCCSATMCAFVFLFAQILLSCRLRCSICCCAYSLASHSSWGWPRSCPAQSASPGHPLCMLSTPSAC